METLRCLSTDTTDGQPCQQIVALGTTQCAAGHPLVPHQGPGASGGGCETSVLEGMPEMTFDEEEDLLQPDPVADIAIGRHGRRTVSGVLASRRTPEYLTTDSLLAEGTPPVGKIRYNPLVNGLSAKGIRLSGDQLRQHQRDHRGSNFFRANFKGSDLSGEDLTGLDLMSVRLQGANLSGVTGHDVFLWRANLEGANLRGARFVDDERAEHDSSFTKTNFTDADMTGAAFETVDMSEAVFTGADLAGASFRGSDLRHTDFRGAKNVGQADFTNADLYGARFDAGAEPEGWVPFGDSEHARRGTGRVPVNPSQGAFSRYFSFTDYRFDGLVQGTPRDKQAENRRLKGRADEEN